MTQQALEAALAALKHAQALLDKADQHLIAANGLVAEAAAIRLEVETALGGNDGTNQGNE